MRLHYFPIYFAYWEGSDKRARKRRTEGRGSETRIVLYCDEFRLFRFIFAFPKLEHNCACYLMPLATDCLIGSIILVPRKIPRVDRGWTCSPIKASTKSAYCANLLTHKLAGRQRGLEQPSVSLFATCHNEYYLLDRNILMDLKEGLEINFQSMLLGRQITIGIPHPYGVTQDPTKSRTGTITFGRLDQLRTRAWGWVSLDIFHLNKCGTTRVPKVHHLWFHSSRCLRSLLVQRISWNCRITTRPKLLIYESGIVRIIHILSYMAGSNNI